MNCCNLCSMFSCDCGEGSPCKNMSNLVFTPSQLKNPVVVSKKDLIWNYFRRLEDLEIEKVEIMKEIDNVFRS